MLATKEIKKKLPKKMELEMLGDIAKSVKGKKPPNLSSEKTVGFQIPYVDIKAFEKKVFNNYTDGIKCSLCEIDDVLIVWDGARCGLVGRGVKGAIGSTLAKIESKSLIKSYLFYFLQSIFSKINTNPKGVGIPHVDPTILWDSELIVPSIPEQNRIVEKIEELFSELDYAITTLKSTQQQLQTYRQSVLKYAFEGHFTGGMKGWKNVRLADVADIKGGVTKGKKLDGKTTIELPYLRVANVQDGYLDLTEIKFIKVLDTDLEKYRLLENDILFTEGGDKDKLGRGTIWKNQIKDCIHQNHIFRARVKKDIVLPKFLEYVTKTQKSRAYFYKVAKQTTNLASINMTQLSNLEFDMPPLKLQEIIISEIETRLSESDYLLQTINEQLVKAESLRQSILQRAFSGEL